MAKVLQIDLGKDNLLRLAESLIDDHNYIDALKMLNKNAALNGNDGYSYMLYADIFDDIGLYEKCINNWFHYIDRTHFEEDMYDAYEGLAISYMNLGNEHFSAFYYNRMLGVTPEVDEETRRSIMDNFLKNDENPLKFVYPPDLADYSETISKGVSFMKSGEYERAVEEFENVAKGSKDYRAARNYIAMCDIITDDCNGAERECTSLLCDNPADVQTLTTLAAVKAEQGKHEESKEIAKRLLSLNVTEGDDIYKIATVCCENGMHEEAFNLFCKLEDELFYDSTVLFFKAVSAYNCGKYNECFNAFEKLLIIYPNAETSRLRYQAARRAREEGSTEPLSYYYRLPREEGEDIIRTLYAYTGLEKSLISPKEREQILNYVHWCFDENDTANEDMMLLGVACALKIDELGLLRDLMLNAFLSDDLKIKILSLIGERDEDSRYGIVISHVYRNVYFNRLNIGRAKRKYFVNAYASLTSHFALIDSRYGDKFRKAAEDVYAGLKDRGMLELAKDVNTLSAAILLHSGVKVRGFSKARVINFFNTDINKVKNVLGEL